MVKRGLFGSADVDGACNILSKVIGNFKFDPIVVCSTPKKINVWQEPHVNPWTKVSMFYYEVWNYFVSCAKVNRTTRFLIRELSACFGGNQHAVNHNRQFGVRHAKSIACDWTHRTADEVTVFFVSLYANSGSPTRYCVGLAGDLKLQQIRSHRLTVRTTGFHPVNVGSTPAGSANITLIRGEFHRLSLWSGKLWFVIFLASATVRREAGS